jgi:hypothetical protein
MNLHFPVRRWELLQPEHDVRGIFPKAGNVNLWHLHGCGSVPETVKIAKSTQHFKKGSVSDNIFRRNCVVNRTQARSFITDSVDLVGRVASLRVNLSRRFPG